MPLKFKNFLFRCHLTYIVNVIYGCSECCTNYLVPEVWRKEPSREPETIRREMLALWGGRVRHQDKCSYPLTADVLCFLTLICLIDFEPWIRLQNVVKESLLYWAHEGSNRGALLKGFDQSIGNLLTNSLA